MKSKRFELRLSQNKRRQLEKLADTMHMPMSQVVHAAISQYLKKPSVQQKLYGQMDLFLNESSLGESPQATSEKSKDHGHTTD